VPAAGSSKLVIMRSSTRNPLSLDGESDRTSVASRSSELSQGLLADENAALRGRGRGQHHPNLTIVTPEDESEPRDAACQGSLAAKKKHPTTSHAHSVHSSGGVHEARLQVSVEITKGRQLKKPTLWSSSDRTSSINPYILDIQVELCSIDKTLKTQYKSSGYLKSLQRPSTTARTQIGGTQTTTVSYVYLATMTRTVGLKTWNCGSDASTEKLLLSYLLHPSCWMVLPDFFDRIASISISNKTTI
jgi:hypothetical protein